MKCSGNFSGIGGWETGALLPLMMHVWEKVKRETQQPVWHPEVRAWSCGRGWRPFKEPEDEWSELHWSYEMERNPVSITSLSHVPEASPTTRMFSCSTQQISLVLNLIGFGFSIFKSGLPMADVESKDIGNLLRQGSRCWEWAWSLVASMPPWSPFRLLLPEWGGAGQGGDSMLVSTEGVCPYHVRSGLSWELGVGPDLEVGDHILSAVGSGGAGWTPVVRGSGRTET